MEILKLKNKITEVKKSAEGFNSRLYITVREVVNQNVGHEKIFILMLLRKNSRESTEKNIRNTWGMMKICLTYI